MPIFHNSAELITLKSSPLKKSGTISLSLISTVSVTVTINNIVHGCKSQPLVQKAERAVWGQIC